MILLNFDTALNKTYVAISKDGELLKSKIVENTEDNYHSAFLLSSIKDILKENNLTPKDIDLIGVNVGPGSFTGIRAGLTVAKVMAQELNIKIVPVESLKILSKLNTTNKESVVILDARRSMAYVYKNDKTELLELEKVSEMIKDKDYELITDKNISNLLNINSLVYEDGNYDLGKILNEIAYKNKGTAILPNELKALYIQPPPVFTKK